ncbi:PepSY-associated TM helix domain-containing protein [Marinobacter maritimus]|uniref:PepSY-associated TM helix domain-containing protein n=1 Tax=Marinobacter maritimus TaxID=277961 RepID=UPI001C92CF95|nr:PepSY domain-containing protein [Marinobacter maritimus]|tara:strand:- start:1399 stop:2802 length:1404 start_codon:yes stop_codon:yes gene_type:complete
MDSASDSRVIGQIPEATMARQQNVDLYRAVWRWHFYSGLLVLPFLIILAVTGALYLFSDEIDAVVHADLMTVEVSPGPAITAERQIATALEAYPGTVFKYVPAAAPERSTEVDIKTDDGEKLAVYIDPSTGNVLGNMDYRGSVMWFVRKLHSLAKLGPIANGTLEVAAGLSILLVLTGLYLWWPRGQSGGVVSVRGSREKRVFWRDLHAVTGLGVGGFIVFLALTGMPWSIVWGEKANEFANGHNYGYPTGVRVDVPMSDTLLSERNLTSWSLEQAQLPESNIPDSSVSVPSPIGLDRAILTFNTLGLAAGYSVSMPASADGVFTGSVYPDDLSKQRVIHLDQYSGEVLLDMSYSDYGPVGRGLEWGINVHMGQEFGLVNQLVLLIACLAIVLMSVSAGVMWWKRRPTGKLGIPPLPQNPKRLRGVFALLMIGGVVFPLTGMALVVMVLIDGLLQRLDKQRVELAQA